MEKEKVTEELVRQNGNQAAAVMADYADQGGGAGANIIFYPDADDPILVGFRQMTESDQSRLPSLIGAFYSGWVMDVNGVAPYHLVSAGEQSGGVLSLQRYTLNKGDIWVYYKNPSGTEVPFVVSTDLSIMAKVILGNV